MVKNISLEALLLPTEEDDGYRKNFFFHTSDGNLSLGKKSKLFLSQIFFCTCPFPAVCKKKVKKKKKFWILSKKTYIFFTILTVISEILTLNPEFWEFEEKKSEKKPELWKNGHNTFSFSSYRQAFLLL